MTSLQQSDARGVVWRENLMAHTIDGLHEKLEKLRLSSSPAETHRLLGEVKKYLVIATTHPEREVPMFSNKVDEVWHQVILFTAQYRELSSRFFQSFQHHDPRETSELRTTTSGAPREKMTFRAFCTEYERLFGAIDDAWFEHRGLTLATRVARATWGRPLAVEKTELAVQVVLMREPKVVLCRAPQRMEGAVATLMTGPAFYVRELRGLTDAERIELCERLVAVGVLQVVP